MRLREKRGCEAILQKVLRDDLLSLKDTVTKRQIIAENKSEAIDAILTYTESSLELLKRKKIKREIIFQYLVDCKVAVPVNAEKHILIKKTLEYWGIGDQNETVGPRIRICGIDINQNTSTSQTDCHGVCESSASCTTVTSTQADIQSSDEDNSEPRQPLQELQQHPLQQNPNRSNSSTDLVGSSSSISKAVCLNTEHQRLGETFVSWFYRILNSNNPSLDKTPEDFGPHHFWNDVRLHLVTRTPAEAMEVFEGSDVVSQRFLALMKEEQILFNPNNSPEGIQVKSDPHGLVIILACGTIHRGNDCLGVFQQMFGLIRDPRFDNNWKIKVSKLRIQSMHVTALPRLQDSDVSDMSVVPASDSVVSIT